ncbi:hypothetical protein GKE82_00995 [Conexibacter sp. W3-3-2]|uniref:Uncharacterized protein n=1 Tax=Paraconexibacter algicola TaxID=2133960 RepID=A0A2T4UEF2_9ACTN|nr:MULTISPECIES: hypothetical protein [Solirubrobacterales]MTD42915.1 hypothetical protein [Conexibacter sp. W3-3-2]PTL56170.1 hypothetical protein C7Y72_14355 [Paraconexibacter algicola]
MSVLAIVLVAWLVLAGVALATGWALLHAARRTDEAADRDLARALRDAPSPAAAPRRAAGLS